MNTNLLCKRAADLSVADFQEALRDAVLERMTWRLPDACRLALTRPTGYGKREPIYDAVIEWDLGDEVDIGMALDCPALEAIRSSRILDSSASGPLVTANHVIKDGPIPPGFVKSYEFVTRKPGMPDADFFSYWRTVHGPLAARIPVILRYVQAHHVGGWEQDAVARWDGMAITWFQDTAAMRQSAITAELAETRADEPNFLAPGELPVIITSEQPGW